MGRSCRRWVIACVVAAVCVLVIEEAIMLTGASFYGRERVAAAEVALPLFVKFHKTGGTSVAATLDRCVASGDLEYSRWRQVVDGSPLKKFCGTYDGHWALGAYRTFGSRGARLCGGFFPTRPNAKLVTLLRDPVHRFISRLYYELGGKSDLLLAPPFSRPVAEWSVGDLIEMEAITCRACRDINRGHCHWRGGLCDTPQEYLVVLSQLGLWGPKRGELQTPPASPELAVSYPSSRPRRKRALSRALANLQTDFHVVGVLEELHVFLAALAADLRWPLDKLLYTARKVHDGDRIRTDCPKRLRRLSESPAQALRSAERHRKRVDADRAKKTAPAVAWSGVYPLLGWNNLSAPKTFRNDTLAYARRRNEDDIELWEYARRAARERAPRDLVRQFDLLQTAYKRGLVPNSLGFFAFCDWRSDADNDLCRACASSQRTSPCEIGSTRLRVDVCRLGFEEDTALLVKYGS